MKLFKNKNAHNAVFIGSLCSVSYLAVYVARNILGAVTPQMIESGLYTTEYIGRVSSMYLSFYAVGQLINGMLGDKIKARYMISGGLLFAGVMNFLFTRMGSYPNAAIFVYAMTGFFLAMIYGPMTKVVAENTEQPYTTRCSLGYTFASFLGTPFAGVLAAMFVWQDVFAVGSGILCTMAVFSFVFFLIYERMGIVRYGQFVRKKSSGNPIKILIKRDILRFIVIAILTGVVRTSVVFWMPTYISQHLGFSTSDSALIFTVASFIISATAFLAIFIYERLKRNMYLTIRLMFTTSLAFFVLVYLVRQPVVNIIFLVCAIMASGCCSSMMYSRYCPGLRDTGFVSSATGFLDFVSYMAASASSALFANAVSAIGWQNLIIVWAALMLVGVAISLPWPLLFKKRVRS
ncbi:MAG: MFS transporter [Clostridiales bacterium]|nr:MFS transporter [Clostridiales bacterium]